MDRKKIKRLFKDLRKTQTNEVKDPPVTQQSLDDEIRAHLEKNKPPDNFIYD